MLGSLLLAHTITLIRHHNHSSNVSHLPPSLIISGSFSHSRNPLYLAYVTIVLGTALILGSAAAFLPVVLCFITLSFVIRFEENRLHKKFGSSFRHYRSTVHRWL